MPRSSASDTVPAAPRRRIYAFDDFRVDADAEVLLRGQATVELPSRAFDALVYLMEHRGRVVGKDEIITSIWHDVAVTDDSLIHAVSVLRRELGDDRSDPKYIKTIPRRGYRFIGDVAILDTAPEAPGAATELAGGSRAPETPRAAQVARLPWRGLAAAGAALALLVVVAMGVRQPRPDDAQAHTLRLSQPSPPGARIVSGGALSPDGRYLAFVARDDTQGETAIWIRVLSSDELRPLNGTSGAAMLFWAPDSRRIGFFAKGDLFAVDLAAERPRTIATVGLTPAGGSWGSNETILFADWSTGLHSVDASGDAPVTTVAELDRAGKDISIAWPQFLPGGRRFLYQRISLDPARTGTYVGSLDAPDAYRLIDTESPAVFAPPRHVLHVSKDMLIAEELDRNLLELTGRAIVVARGVSAPGPGADNTVSAAGNLLAFQRGIERQNLAWFDRDGEQRGALSMPTVLFNPRVSPDQSSLLATGSITRDPGLWLASLSREEYARLEGADAIAPLWSPDGRQIAFTSRGGFDLIVRALDEPGAARRLVTDTRVKILNDWSPDGGEIVYTRGDDRTGLDLWSATVEDALTRPILATPFNELHARISPDGKWIAYSSDESGVLEVYVQRYPELGEKRKISGAGGGQPQWRSDQRELFYLSSDREIMAVDVGSARGETVFTTPRALFRAPIAGDPKDARDHYAVNADGTRFLVDGSIRDGDDAAITVMVNWSLDADVRRRDSVSLTVPVPQLAGR